MAGVSTFWVWKRDQLGIPVLWECVEVYTFTDLVRASNYVPLSSKGAFTKVLMECVLPLYLVYCTLRVIFVMARIVEFKFSFIQTGLPCALAIFYKTHMSLRQSDTFLQFCSKYSKIFDLSVLLGGSFKVYGSRHLVYVNASIDWCAVPIVNDSRLKRRHRLSSQIIGQLKMAGVFVK